MTTSIPPSQTLYINHLLDKVHKEELRRALYYLFSQFGQILDVVALKTPKMRGQAFVVFKEISEATVALRALQGFPLFDHPMKIQYAKTKSNAAYMAEGVYNPELARELERKEPSTSHKTASASKKRTRSNDEQESEHERESESEEEANGQPPAKRLNQGQDSAPPNHVLFLTNLPSTVTEAQLSALFQQYKGFVEIRTVPGKKDIAFAEYESVQQATTAKEVLDGFEVVSGKTMHVAFAKQ